MQANQSPPPRNKIYRGYWVLIALAVLFIGPFVAAWSYYTSGNNWVPSKINYGELLTPVRSIKPLSLTTADGGSFATDNLAGKWSLLFIEPNVCKEACQQTLYNIRQARLALGENMERVQRYIATLPNIQQPTQFQQELSKKFAGTEHVQVGATPEQLAQQFATNTQALNLGQIYLIDPLGNIIMRYPATIGPEAIYNDLKRLLKVSQIG